MKILHKIIIGNLLVCLLFTIIAIIGISSIYKINEGFEKIDDQTLPVINSLENLRIANSMLIASTGEYIFLRDEAENAEIEAFESSNAEKEKINNSEKEFSQEFQIYESYVNRYFPEERIYVNNLMNSQKDLLLINRELIMLKDQNESGLNILKKWEEFEASEKIFNNEIIEVLNHEYNEIAMEKEKVVKSIRESLTISIFFAVISLMGTLAFGFFMSKTFSDPINEMMEATHKIAEGDFNTRINIKSNDEIGNLASSFNIMAYDLEKSKNEQKKNEVQIMNSLKEKETLLKEIHHRVKNNMQIISSLLNHQAENIADAASNDLLKESQSRIASMALVHEKLYQSKDFDKINISEYINDLSANIFQSYDIDPGKIRFIMDVDNSLIGIDQVIPCGLIINELITNSIKYAFGEGKTGEINISFHNIGGKMSELIVGDNGKGIPEDFDFKKTRSLGLHLVTILTEKQLHGQIDLDRTKGTQFRIRFGE